MIVPTEMTETVTVETTEMATETTDREMVREMATAMIEMETVGIIETATETTDRETAREMATETIETATVVTTEAATETTDRETARETTATIEMATAEMTETIVRRPIDRLVRSVLPHRLLR